MAPPNSYLAQRLEALNFPQEKNRLGAWAAAKLSKGETPLFEESPEGDILINYFDLDGTPALYQKNGRGKWHIYQVRRKRDPGKGPKYAGPPGEPTRIYWPPQMLEAYAQNRHLTRLFVIEGQFKALAGALAGLPICAAPGIWNFRDTDKTRLKEDIRAFSQRCKVMDIVCIQDADFRAISYERDKELTTRPQGFLSAALAFRDAARASGLRPWLCTLAPSLATQAKGLDDLLQLDASKAPTIIQALWELKDKDQPFHIYDLNTTPERELRRHYGLSGVSDFFAIHRPALESQEFVYRGGRYRYDADREEIFCTYHQDAELFIRVGDQYRKMVEKVNLAGDTFITWKDFKNGTIAQDYVREQRITRFMHWIKKYDDVISLPDHSPNFQAEITTPKGSKLFNMAAPMPYQPEPGQFPTIERYFQHVFGTHDLPSGQPGYIMGYDYFTIAYRTPTQKLPIIILVNREGDTGKSTLLDLVREIWGLNAIKVSNTDLISQYNDHYITKEFALIDEGVIDKRHVLEMVKSLCTSPRDRISARYLSNTEIDIYLKFIFTSNDEDNCIPIRPEETRFWVLKVPRIQGPRDPEMLKKMKAEIPAFLHYLASREIVHPRRERTWFAYDLLQTEALRRLVSGSRSWVEKEIREVIRDWFFQIGHPELCYTFSDIFAAVSKSRQYQKFEVQAGLEKMGYTKPKNSSYTFYQLENLPSGPAITSQQRKGRFYTFRAADFLSPDELKELSPQDALPF